MRLGSSLGDNKKYALPRGIDSKTIRSHPTSSVSLLDSIFCTLGELKLLDKPANLSSCQIVFGIFIAQVLLNPLAIAGRLSANIFATLDHLPELMVVSHI